MIQHLKQQTKFGCMITCLAMVTGKPLDTVTQEITSGAFGATDQSAIHYLSQHGYKVKWKQLWYTPTQTKRTDDDMRTMFRCVNIVSVKLPQGYHAIVVFSDGTVYDPDPNVNNRTLIDYPVPSSVIGVFE